MCKKQSICIPWYDTYNKYNTFTKGKRDFASGTLQLLLGEVQCDNGFLQAVDYLNDFRTRIMDNTTKILKSRKGEIYKVKTHNLKISPFEGAIKSQPYLVSFEFIECEEV